MNPLWWAQYPLRIVPSIARPLVPGVDYSLELTVRAQPEHVHQAAYAQPVAEEGPPAAPTPATVDPVQKEKSDGDPDGIRPESPADDVSAQKHPTKDDVMSTRMPSSQPLIPPTVEPVQEVGQTGYARTRATMGHAEVHGAQVGLPRPWPPTSDPDRSANLTGESRAPADRSRSPWRGHSHDEDLVVTMDPRDEETWKGKAKGLARGRGHWSLVQKGKGHPLNRVWQPFPTSSSSSGSAEATDQE